jgi:hypothetical protein
LWSQGEEEVVVVVEKQVYQVGEETWKSGDEWWWGGGEYEGVDEREMEGALFAAHGGFHFLFSFPSPICALDEANRLDSPREKERERERERHTGRHRERQRHRECACVRARGFRSTWYLCPP